MSKFFIFLFLFSLTFANHCLATDPSQESCRKLLVSPQERTQAFFQELETATQTSQPLRRAFLKIRGRLARQEILKKCVDSGNCTAAQIALTIKDTLLQNPEDTDAVGYGFLLGGMVVTAAVSAGITSWINPQVEFISTFVGFMLGQTTFIGANLLSPFSEPISTKMRRFAFSLKSPDAASSAQAPHTDLDAKADAIHATSTLREQYVGDRILLFRNSLMLNLSVAQKAVDAEDYVLLAAQLGDALFNGYNYIIYIDPREAGVLNAISASFATKNKSNLPDSDTLKLMTMNFIRALTKKRLNKELDAKALAYYTLALDAWLPEVLENFTAEDQ